jgi:hypothetical protein
MRFFGGCAAGEQLAIAIGEVLGEFFGEPALGRGIETQGGETVANDLIPIRHDRFR